MPLLIWTALKRFRAHHAGLFAGAIVAAVLFFVIGVGIRLLMGPVSLAPVSGQLSQALANALPGLSVKFDKAGLEWSRESGRVDLVILGARVFDSGGRIIAQAPKADLGLAAGPLVHGKIVVKRITLVGVQLTLVRTRDGGLRLGVSADKDQPDLIKEINDAINASNSGSSALDVLAIRDARLAFMDEGLGLFVVAPKAGLEVRSAGKNLSTSVDADVEISGRKAHIAGSMLLPPDDAPVPAQLTVTGLDLDALGRNAKALAILKPLRLIVDATGKLTLVHGRIAKLGFTVAAHGGIAGMGPKGTGLLLGNVNLAGRYDSAAGRFDLDNAELHGGPFAGRARGTAMLAFDNGELASITEDVTADNVTLALRQSGAPRVSFARVGLQGSYTAATGEAVISHLTMLGHNLDAQASGKLVFAGKTSPSIEASGRVGAMAVRDFLTYWPPGVADGARDWIAQNISTGQIGPIAATAHIPAGALDAPALAENMLTVSFPFSGVSADYLKGLTPITQGKGTGTLTGDSFTAEVSSGRIGPLILSKGRAVIANLHVPGTVGDITAHVDGQMRDILRLIDMKPLNYPTRFHIDPAATGGSAAVDLSFRVPMLKFVSVNAIGILVQANVANLDMILGKEAHLTQGNLALTVDAKHLQAVGTAAYSGKAVTLDWTEDFESASDITTRIAAKAVMDQAARAAFGLDLGDYLTGPVNVTAALTGHRGLLRHADLAVDLAPAAISMPLLNYHKAPGVAATANVAANFAGDSAIHDADIKLSGASLSASGTARFGAGGSVNQIAMSQMKIGAANDFSLQYRKGLDNGVDLVLRGHSLDGTAIAGRGGKSDSSSKNKEDKFDGPFHLRVNLDHMALRAGVALSNFSLDVSGIENRPQALSLSGSLSKTAGISGTLTAINGQRQIVLDTTDASLLLKGVFGFTSIRGGHVHVTATFPHPANVAPPDGSVDYQGTITAQDFRILNQPFLTRLFTAGSLQGLLNLMGGQGVAVDTMTVPYVAQKGVLTIRDARATGPSIGISADGYLDRAKNDIGLRGTIAPLYGLNTVLNNIPILGDVLTSHKGEGIFGIAYTVSGNADEPHVSVNPLTLLTPGILRRIFQSRIPVAPQASPPAATPEQ